jgi:hypothetical protein
MLKPYSFIFCLILVFLFLNACKESEEKNLESIAITPSGQQTCNYYDTSDDNGDYVSGINCDNDDLNYIQFTLTGNYSNGDKDDITKSSLVTWTVEDSNGESAAILSDNVDGRAYLSSTGTFNIDAKYFESASSENEDDIIKTTNVVLVVK